jgi:CHAT domain-containing protein
MANPTRADVLSKLLSYDIVHFACHGVCVNDPSQNSLSLQDWETEPLTVSDFTSLNIMSAKFAYLSACRTSVMRNLTLLDESISLSSAIQLSGYPSVMGSLWQVGDDYSAQVSRDVYKWISQGKLDIKRPAEGLHKAVCNLRDKMDFRMKNNPLCWASFIHISI